jgi:uroporphyrinogen decarboxylase
MDSRERVRLALAHREPDRVPFDLGGTVLTSMHHVAYQRLREILRLPPVEPKIMDFIQQIVEIDADLRQLWETDVTNVAPRSSATYKIEINTTDMEGYNFFHDEFGIGWRSPKDGGFFYDMYHHPLAGSISTQNIDNYPWPDPTDPARFEGLAERARKLAEEDGQAVILGGLTAGFMEIAAWMRGFADYYADLAGNQELIGYLMDKIIDLKLQYWEIALPLVGNYVDVVQEADDFAGQFDMLFSPRTFRKLMTPRQKYLFGRIHALTDAKLFFHSCGSIRKVIPDLIENGVDIINPVQVSATGMDPYELKREYGKDLVFWGGGVDTQRVLGNGTAQQVREDVRHNVDALAKDGGFVFAAVHNIQANVPPENIVAMVEALREYGVY